MRPLNNEFESFRLYNQHYDLLLLRPDKYAVFRQSEDPFSVRRIIVLPQTRLERWASVDNIIDCALQELSIRSST